jgi:diguanylate cyclase (GGDEF)-like protein
MLSKLRKHSSFLLWNGSVLATLSASVVLMALPLVNPAYRDAHEAALALAVLTIVIELLHLHGSWRRILARDTVYAEAQEARTRTNELFAMTDMLQSADGYDDATAVLIASSQRLLPQFGTALYVFNNSRDRLDLTGSWNMPESFTPAEALNPSNCWALKRGKFHINDPGSHTLCCAHHNSRAATIEIPMMARGSVYGLLVLASDAADAERELRAIQRLGRALADSMSLALSNIALREKLRTQSLRDPLTGLYNRRYMEDALERYVSLAERTGSPTALIMVDLDHFKALNDEHGHAKGDAVLRDVAAQLVGGLRPSDVVCRYGGEELVVILPNCAIEDARLKAEALRARIEGLSEVHQATISASFGVAAIPETSSSGADVLPMADAALYTAKMQGRNRVVCAERRAGREDCQPRLAVLG